MKIIRKVYGGLFVTLFLGGMILILKSNADFEKLEKLELSRLTPLLEQVQKKAIGEDNYFSSEEQIKFLDRIGYKQIYKDLYRSPFSEGKGPIIIEGEVPKFGIERHAKNFPNFVLKVDNKRYVVPEKNVEKYLSKF